MHIPSNIKSGFKGDWICHQLCVGLALSRFSWRNNTCCKEKEDMDLSLRVNEVPLRRWQSSCRGVEIQCELARDFFSSGCPRKE